MNKELLQYRLDELISSLSDNPTAGAYYQKVREKLIKTNDRDELKKFLDAICGSAKVKDVHGLNLAQSSKWDSMWDEADKLRSKI